MINGNPRAKLEKALLYIGLLVLVLCSTAAYGKLTRIDPSIEPTAITLERHTLEMQLAEQASLQVKVTPAIATTIGENEWSTSDKSIVTVYPSGIMIARSKGTATVTVRRGNLVDSCTVKVK